MKVLCLAFLTLAGCNEAVTSSPILDAATSFRNVGDPCPTDQPMFSDCGYTPQFFCDTSNPNGYCKGYCNSDGDCPMGAVCVGAGNLVAGECRKSCTQSTAGDDCRVGEGYACKLAGSASHSYCGAVSAGPDGGA